MDKSDKYGWIFFNEDRIIETAFQGHIQELIKDSRFQSLTNIRSEKDWTDKEQSLYDEDEEEFESMIEPGEHPAWHAFHPRTIVDWLASFNIYRFGTYTDSRDRLVLEIEGRLDLKPSQIKDFVNRHFVVDRIAYTQSYWGRKYINL